jgi:hypothetical protein
LNLLVDEVRLDGSKLHIKGSYGALARAIKLSKEGKLGEVPSFVPEWRPHSDLSYALQRVGCCSGSSESQLSFPATAPKYSASQAIPLLWGAQRSRACPHSGKAL